MLSQHRSKRKETGSRYKANRRKRKYEMAGAPTLTKLAERRLKVKRVMGSHEKQSLLTVDVVNVFDPKEKKHYKIKIKTILENPANAHFVRRNIMMKGTVIDTEKGKAKIMNRPGQEGTVNAVLI